MSERVSDSVYHCTALIISPSGELATTYRKRATLGVSQTPGTAPCVFQTEHGLVGVLICYDAENPQYVNEALDLEPVLILNPVHISSAALRSGISSGNRGNKQERDLRWRTSMESMGRHVDRIVARERGKVAWIRCDQPYPIGAGTSQIVESCRTQHVPTCGTTNWSVLVELGVRGESRVSKLPGWICRPPKRDRTDDRDNCGNRYTTKSVEVDVGDFGNLFSEETTDDCLSLVHAKDSRGGKFPTGVIHVLVGNERRTSVDMHRMAEIKIEDDDENGDVKERTGNQVLPNGMTFADVSGTRFYVSTPEPSSKAMKLMLRQPAADKALETKTEATKSVSSEEDECRHVFVAPVEGISAITYVENHGVIVTISQREGSSVRNMLLQDIDGVAAPSSQGRRGRRSERRRLVVTVWEFSQNRIPMPLHELLS
jgi:hypothetical protein